MVKTLQHYLDTAFRPIRNAKVPTPPSEEMLGRERAFREQADKIEKLRQKRISTQSFVFEVVRHRGHWCILHGNKYSKPFDGQAEAIDEAQQAARTKAAQGYPVEVIVRQAD